MVDAVINKVGLKVTPSTLESLRFSKAVSEAITSLFNAFTSSGVSVEVAPGGSFARGTWLPGAHDADLFVRFINEYDLKSFPKVVLKVFPDALRIKGSRDYFKVLFSGYELELIPTLKVNSPGSVANSMDASFFHVDYLNARLNDDLRAQARVLKQFCRALGVYGAESFVSGFSGYVLELLIVHFKSFKNVLSSLIIKPDLFIDLESYYKSRSQAVTALGDKSSSPLIIIDPVNPLRNASRSVSDDALARFVLGARLFFSNPSESLFKLKPLTGESLSASAKKRGHAIFFKSFTPSVRRDAFFSKLSRELSKVASTLESFDFIIHDYGFNLDGLVYFEVVNPVLPLSRRIIGPSVYIDDFNLSKFLLKHKRVISGPYVHDGRACFDVKREVTQAKPLVIKLLNSILIN